VNDAPPSIRQVGAGTVLLLVVAHAVLFTLSFPPFGAWSLALLAPIPLAIACLLARRGSTVVSLVVVTQLGSWLYLQGWMVEVTLPGYLAFAVYLALFSGVEALCLRLLVRGRPGISLGLALPVTLVGIDWFRGYVLFDGYPWYLRGQPLVDLPAVAALARLGGVWLPSFVMLALSGVLADGALLLAGRLHRSLTTSRLLPGTGIVVLGFLLLLAPSVPAASDTRSILMVQTNLPTSNKIAWSFEDQQRDVRGFIRQTIDALDSAEADGLRVDLVVWPETMLPSVGFEHGDLFTRAIEDTVAATGVPMLVGTGSYLDFTVAPDGSADWSAHHNSAYLVTPAGSPYQRVDKVFLTPFGETMPYISGWDWLEERLLAFGAGGMSFDLDAGSDIVRPVLQGPVDGTSVNLGVPICFEDTMATVVRDMVWVDGVRKADLLVNISNDGWFGSDEAGRLMHTLCARWRAIENDTWMIRVANTGQSVVIDPTGSVVDAIAELREPGTLVAEVGVRRGGPTPYARLGEALGGLAAFALLVGLVVEWRSRRTRRRTVRG